MEYCAHGSLYHALSDESIYFTWPLFFQIAREMVEGLIALNFTQRLQTSEYSLNKLLSRACCRFWIFQRTLLW